MKKNILELSFSKLNKDEVQSFADSVIMIVDNHNPETLNINEIFEILVEQKPQIMILRKGYGSHPVTPKLEKFRTRRNAYAQGIVNEIKTIERAKVRELEDHVQLVKPVVFRCLYQLSRSSEISKGESIKEFFNDLILNPQLSVAFGALNLSTQLDNLQEVCSEITLDFNSRRADISARPKKKTPIIASKLKACILDLFKQIEVAQIKHKELDYTPLIDELNNEIARLKALLKARASYNKKKAEKELENTEVVEIDNEVVESPSEEPSASAQSTQRMYPTNVEVDDNEVNLEQLEIEKTVAVSGKQTRLPIVSKEA